MEVLKRIASGVDSSGSIVLSSPGYVLNSILSRFIKFLHEAGKKTAAAHKT
jgi:hypothetical protein